MGEGEREEERARADGFGERLVETRTEGEVGEGGVLGEVYLLVELQA